MVLVDNGELNTDHYFNTNQVGPEVSEVEESLNRYVYCLPYFCTSCVLLVYIWTFTRDFLLKIGCDCNYNTNSNSNTKLR